MKNSIKALITILISSYSLGIMAQQNTNGVYLTEKDYKSHKLSYVLGSHDKIQLNEFLNGKHINLTYQGKNIELAKTDIFGYRQHNQDFRYFQNEAYSIVDTAGFMLYSREKLSQQVKGYKPAIHYFYSINTAQPVLELTLDNLNDSFPDQAGFRYSLQNYFGKDDDLMAYDKAAHQYKIKYLYFQQKQVLASHQKSRDK
jgi:hypothetical protein